jgi:predicted O-linked N-acetylglucosamine transferase (SPINDLY family)
MDRIVWNLWMSILIRVPNSVLVIFQPYENVTVDNIHDMLKKRGLGIDRIKFAKFIPHIQHVQRIGMIDLALDTLVFNGHTSNTDVLWGGVPIVTYPDQDWLGKVGTSLNLAMGLTETIAKSYQDYEDIAVNLALGERGTDD